MISDGRLRGVRAPRHGRFAKGIWRPAVATAVAAILAAGCATTTRGIGASAPSSSSPHLALDCPVEAIRPRGGPFCYQLPEYFTDFSKDTDYGKGWPYRSLVSMTDSDSIVVLGTRYAIDLDSLNDVQRQSYFDAVRFKVGEDGVVKVSAFTPTSVDGADGYEQDLTYGDRTRAHEVSVIKGHAMVLISCQKGPDAYAEYVDRACADLLKFIQISGE